MCDEKWFKVWIKNCHGDGETVCMMLGEVEALDMLGPASQELLLKLNVGGKMTDLDGDDWERIE